MACTALTRQLREETVSPLRAGAVPYLLLRPQAQPRFSNTSRPSLSSRACVQCSRLYHSSTGPPIPQLRCLPPPTLVFAQLPVGPALYLHPAHSQGQGTSLLGDLGRHRPQLRGTRPSRLFLGCLSSAFHHPSLSGLLNTHPEANFPWLLCHSGFH